MQVIRTRLTRLLLPGLFSLAACTAAPVTTVSQGNLNQLTLPGKTPASASSTPVVLSPSPGASASAAASATPATAVRVRNLLVWEVKPIGLKEPVSYLVGTVHAPLASDFQIPAAFTAKLATAKALYTEADLNVSDAEAQASIQKTLDTKQNLETLLGAKDWAALQQWLKDGGLVIPDAALRLFRPWFITETLSSTVRDKLLGKFTASSSLDGVMVSLAKKAGVGLKYLETVDDQFTAQLNISAAEQLRVLKETLSKGQDKMGTELVEVFRMYNQSDLVALEKSEADFKQESAEYYEQTLIKRNQAWIKLLTPVLKAESTVVAVGSLHMAGTQGLVKQLQGQGFDVSPVSFGSAARASAAPIVSATAAP